MGIKTVVESILTKQADKQKSFIKNELTAMGRGDEQ